MLMQEEQEPSSKVAKPRIRMNPTLSGFIAAACNAVATIAFVMLVPGLDREYGMVLFGVVPLVVGFSSALLLGPKEGASWKKCLLASMWSLLFVGVGILIFALEGIICLVMALPIVVPMLVMGAYGGWRVLGVVKRRHDRGISVALAVLAIPLLLNREASIDRPVVRHVETTSMVIHAAPEVVWKYVCSTRKLPKANELLFRAGFAHPTDIELMEPKLGGKRVCRLSTGDMPEQVDAWQPSQRLGFRVLDTPPSMEETGLYGPIQTAHLTGYFLCERGEFNLERLPNGDTRLSGTSWYANRIAPDFYWHLWTDSIVEAVHVRVMNEIRNRAEKDTTESHIATGL